MDFVLDENTLRTNKKECPHCGCKLNIDKDYPIDFIVCQQCQKSIIYKSPEAELAGKKAEVELERMRKEKQREIDDLIAYFTDLVKTITIPELDIGLHIRFRIDKTECCLEIGLPHVGKKEIIRLIGEGKLYGEILTLYTLAHLPYATYYQMNVDPYGFDIIDLVTIHLHDAFHPLHKAAYKHVIDKHIYSQQLEIKPLPNDCLAMGIDWMKQRRKGRKPSEIKIDKS